MNKIKVRKHDGTYDVFVDNVLVYSAVAMNAVLDWLDENFSPPISVRWSVGSYTTQPWTKNS